MKTEDIMDNTAALNDEDSKNINGGNTAINNGNGSFIHKICPFCGILISMTPKYLATHDSVVCTYCKKNVPFK